MSATIYYFSGTGNSYSIAKGIATGLKGSLVSMASAVGGEDITVDGDTIGIVFPVYYTDVPNIVRVLISKLKGLSSKYVFAVSNFGGGAGSSIKTVKELVRENGGELSAAYGVRMPQNAFLKPWVKNDKLIAKMEAEIRRICRKTENKVKRVSSKRLLDIALMPITPMFRSITRNYMLKTVNGSESDTNMSLIYRLDCVFSISDKCNGCGICSNVCPSGNIVMKDGKPEWSHRCENCLACYNFCPQKAISGIAQKDYYYINPGYTMKLAKQQRSPAE